MDDESWIKDKVMEAMAKAVGQPDSRPDLSLELDSQGIDSLTVLRLKPLLEQAFDLRLSDTFDQGLRTGEDLVALVKAALGAPAS